MYPCRPCWPNLYSGTDKRSNDCPSLGLRVACWHNWMMWNWSDVKLPWNDQIRRSYFNSILCRKSIECLSILLWSSFEKKKITIAMQSQYQSIHRWPLTLVWWESQWTWGLVAGPHPITTALRFIHCNPPPGCCCCRGNYSRGGTTPHCVCLRLPDLPHLWLRSPAISLRHGD